MGHEISGTLQDGQPYLADIELGNVLPERGDFSLYFMNCQPQSAVSFKLQVRLPVLIPAAVEKGARPGSVTQSSCGGLIITTERTVPGTITRTLHGRCR